MTVKEEFSQIKQRILLYSNFIIMKWVSVEA